jgi:hypothetical protein
MCARTQVQEYSNMFVVMSNEALTGSDLSYDTSGTVGYQPNSDSSLTFLVDGDDETRWR